MPTLYELTAVPAGWPVETVLDAFVHLASYSPAVAGVQRAYEAVEARLVELWAARPAEAAAWRGLNEDRSQERLAELLLQHWRSELSRWRVTSFSEAGLQRETRSRTLSLSEWEAQVRPRCWELAGRLAAAEAEAEETARKRQKLEAKGQEAEPLREEKRQLGERLEAAEAELHSAKEVVAQQKLENAQLNASLEAAQAASAEKQQELQAAKHQCELLTERVAAAEATLADKAREVQAAQDEGVAQKDWCEQLARRLEASEAEASGKQRELHRLQADCDGNKADLKSMMENAALKKVGDLLEQQLAKAEAKLEAKSGQMQALSEEKGVYKERCRQLACQLAEAKEEAKRLRGGPPAQASLASHGPGVSREASSHGSSLAEQLGYTVVEDDVASSVLSRSSGFSVKPDCFMPEAVFKSRSSVMDFYLMGKDLQKSSQVVAGDGESIMDVVEISKEHRKTELVSLEAGDASLQVTHDHLVQVPDANGELGKMLYQKAGALKVGDLVVLDSGEPVPLTNVHTEPAECEVLRVVFDPDLPVAAFSCPPCILTKGHKRKPPVRRGGMCSRGKGAASTASAVAFEAADGGASMPDTAAGVYTD